jgi:hypothetical protein
MQHPPFGQAPALLSNIRLECKAPSGTNTSLFVLIIYDEEKCLYHQRRSKLSVIYNTSNVFSYDFD